MMIISDDLLGVYITAISVIWCYFRYYISGLVEKMKWHCIPFLWKVLFYKDCDKTDQPEGQELSEGGSKIKSTPNAGGLSQISEALSFEFFYRICKAILLKVVLIVYLCTISCLFTMCVCGGCKCACLFVNIVGCMVISLLYQYG